MANPAMAREENYVLTLEEIGNLTQEGGKPAETLMNVVALIARRFQTDVCSAYLLEPDRDTLDPPTDEAGVTVAEIFGADIDDAAGVDDVIRRI